MDNEIIRIKFGLMNTNKIIIAVDGYSSTGKSSISKAIANALGFIHIDTGAMYRAITLFALRNFRTKNGEIDLEKLLQHLDEISLDFREEEGALQIYINNENVSKEIRESIVSEHVSEVAKEPKVRGLAVKQQRKMVGKSGLIMDGRDIGTVVFPDADYKFFLTASVDERARRRTLEMESMGMETNFDEVKQNLIERDRIDSEREISPLKQADDAILIDNTELNKEQTIALILSYIQK